MIGSVSQTTARKNEIDIEIFTLNGDTSSLTLLNYGATMASLKISTPSGVRDVLIGFDDPFDYIELGIKQNAYFGAIIGRTCNRISEGKIILNGNEYQLPVNNGPNSLHGGLIGFDKRFWNGNVVSQDPPSVCFTLVSADQEQGYPGEIEIICTYTLIDNEVIIDTLASLCGDQEQETIVNLTAHPYFDLSGGASKSINESVVKMNGVKGCMCLDKNQIPTGMILTVNTNPELFFDQPRCLGFAIPDVQEFGGFDHYYLMEKGENFIEIVNPTSSISLTCSSSATGFQFYTGNWLDGSIGSKAAHTAGSYARYSAFCIEPSEPPNSVNMKAYRDKVILTKGKPLKQQIKYKLSIISSSSTSPI